MYHCLFTCQRSVSVKRPIPALCCNNDVSTKRPSEGSALLILIPQLKDRIPLYLPATEHLLSDLSSRSANRLETLGVTINRGNLNAIRILRDTTLFFHPPIISHCV